MAKKQVIRLTENDLRKVIKESVKNVLKEAKPSDRTVGKHTLKGLRYDKNGNPLYTSDTMSDDEKKNQGWRFSKKHGLYGQLSDPTKLSESDLHKVIKETVNRVLSEEEYKDPFNFFPNKDFSKEPTHRINFFYRSGGDSSSPAIFSTDEEAITAAIENAKQSQGVSGGVVGIQVEKYTGVRDNGSYELETIYSKGNTY